MSEAADRVVLEESWKLALREEFDKSYMSSLRNFLQEERKLGKRIFPPMKKIFKALDLCPLNDVRVVIIGQDPYIRGGQAHGLAFSVPIGVRPPPSLENIFLEIEEDMRDASVPAGDKHGSIDRKNGCLESWANQGVLLLNSTLTVIDGKSGSHQGRGWEKFTDKIVEIVNDSCESIVFLLWGAYAKRKGEMLDTVKHLVLTAAHPSPLSAYSGFFGCRHFSKTNQYLVEHGKKPINWFEVS